jgi:t-SNARE complex subunit (syntaxin)
LEDLHRQVKALDSKKIKWLMTQADTVSVRKTFKDYTISTYRVYRLQYKEYKDELMIKNY